MNNPGIFLIQPNAELLEMNEQAPPSESQLQSWLEKYPSLLAGHQIDPDEPRRWLLIERECGVPSEEGGGGRWAIDHLFLDQDAIPTIVEVKRRANTEIRRQVVGQMLDYAANAVDHWPVPYMRERFTATCNECGLDPDEKLSEFVGEDADPEEFWEKADRNLRDGNIRLIFVADNIPKELQRVVEFPNEQMDRTEVLAVEIKQYVGRGQTGLVPRVIGQTADAIIKKRTGGSVTEDEIDKLPPDERKVATKILEWSHDNSSRVEWRGASFVPVFDYDSHFSHNPITVYCSSKVPRVQIKFGRMKNRNGLSDDTRRELLRRLNSIPGVKLPQDSIDRFPNILLSTLANDVALEQFLSAIGWTIQEVKAAQAREGAAALSRSAQS